ncbi:MAG: hypothetical protein KIT09_07555 [Bryobacteraceae bacterium]|nr:hypothetical protein [Bryobacteraceae bacterium]
MLVIRTLLAILVSVPALSGAEPRIIPQPQYFEALTGGVAAGAGSSVRIVFGPAGAAGPKMKLAGAIVAAELKKYGIGAGAGGGAPAIHIWNYAAGKPGARLNLLDRRTLTEPGYFGQGYVITTSDDSVWVIGASEQGALLGTMSLLQLIRPAADGIRIEGAYIRDYPDFEFRLASDWLMNGEVNRWSLDRAQGPEAFRKLMKQRIDRSLRYKVNMALVDGFGWGLKERFEGYSELMLDLNRYARARGIRLMFGGYGASYGIAYQTGPIYEEGAYLGEVFRNRESYPDGPTYQCLGFDRGKTGVDASILGSCRGNERLNALKAEELRRFVEAVEPGALYIHHEDFGNFRRMEKVWQKRCARCRARWPNDALAAADGGAGGLANGYAALIRAVNSVQSAATGYDAARDCEIVLISPVYSPDSPDSEDWSNALELWKNIGEQLPRSANVQVGFREVFPQRYGRVRWSDHFNQAMMNAGLDLGLFLYFAGGSDDWVTDYPLTGVPAMNAMFRGATTIYNGTGDFYKEPMEIISAEYSWNTRSAGFFADPATHQETVPTWRRYIFRENQPEEVFGAGGLYELTCKRLYGPEAGPIMADYYRASAYLPDTPLTEAQAELGTGYLPMSWNRIYATPSHWRHLALDAKTWGPAITNDRYLEVMRRLNLDRAELHRRLARRWRLGEELNERGAATIEKALAAGPRAEAVDDLRFLAAALRVCRPLMEALAEYHAGLEGYFSGGNRPGAKAVLARALEKAQAAQKAAAEAFPHPVDPVGGDVGAIRRYADALPAAIETILGES